MVHMPLLTYEQLTNIIATLVPTIKDKWLQELDSLYYSYPERLPQEISDTTCYLLSFFLLHDDYKCQVSQSSHEMGIWFWSQKLPLSLLLKTYHTLDQVYSDVFDTQLKNVYLSPENFSDVSKKFKEVIDNTLYQAVQKYEDLVQLELNKKEEAISFLHHDKLDVLDKIAANMAHELRNPLCAIEGFLKLIRENASGNSELEGYVNVVFHEFDGFHRLITGFLSFCKKPILDEVYKEISMVDLLQEVELLVIPRLHAENVTLSIRMEPCYFYCYKEGLLQVIIHLLNNAIDAVSTNTHKFVQISSYNHLDSLTIIVENNGEEIPEDLVDIMFQPFFSTKNEGVGIGLSICKNLIDKHNGQIICESNRERTRFIIQLPYNHPITQ
ncbi:sensor histidine kinase [Brevibacillus daliensis]|uniref:sensor histidine kinase n=1 Tax=Brevibacillus daliensis TaxID=2892995 RepID=UPI001E51CDEC|nr:HAMP domain-containing sensor histidine kinase [Brevibacillus daliensis]